MLDLDKEELEGFVKKEGGDKLIMYYSKKVTELNDEERYSPWLTPEDKVTRNILRDDAYREGEERDFTRGERKEKKNIALNMLAKGLDILLITKITGLSEKPIKKLSI